MGKKILIIGNGFDLEHKLPTKYSDFMDFSERFVAIYKARGGYKKNTHIANTWDIKNEDDLSRIEPLKNYLRRIVNTLFHQKIGGTPLTLKEMEKWEQFNKFLYQNVWYSYFVNTYGDFSYGIGERWIDFESEISHIVSVIDKNTKSIQDEAKRVFKSIKRDWRVFLFQKQVFQCYSTGPNKLSYESFLWTIKDVRDKMYDDLNKLILAFEIYLDNVVSPITIHHKIPYLDGMKFDYVISFNYTKTYETYYKTTTNNPDICYIHGEADSWKRDVDHNNMVIGIDEYLSEEKRDTHTDFAIFKKFVQRIRKHNDVIYSSWLEEIEKIGKTSNPDQKFSDVYIIGHSLDITDKDILRRFIISPYTRIHILTRNKASEGGLISNIIRIADEKTIIEKSTTYPPFIDFQDYHMACPKTHLSVI